MKDFVLLVLSVQYHQFTGGEKSEGSINCDLLHSLVPDVLLVGEKEPYGSYTIFVHVRN